MQAARISSGTSVMRSTRSKSNSLRLAALVRRSYLFAYPLVHTRPPAESCRNACRPQS